MQANRQRVLSLTYEVERGYSNHPDDPGGPTQDGITQRTLSAERHRPVTIDELKSLGAEERDRIYEQEYLDPIQFDKLRSGLDLAVADCAINSGPDRAARLLQQALGMTGRHVDGLIGAQTLDAMNKARDLEGLIEEYCRRRLAFCRSLANWRTFGVGWTHRIEQVIEPQAVLLSRNTAVVPAGVPVEVATLPETATAKATGAVRVTSMPSGQAALATIGSVAGVAIVAAGQASGMLQPYAGVQAVRYILIGLAVVSASATFAQTLLRARNGATA